MFNFKGERIDDEYDDYDDSFMFTQNQKYDDLEDFPDTSIEKDEESNEKIQLISAENPSSSKKCHQDKPSSEHQSENIKIPASNLEIHENKDEMTAMANSSVAVDNVSLPT